MADAAATVISNRTPYSDGEVRCIIMTALAASAGPRPRRVVVGYRRDPTDDRLGFTPYDHKLPTDIWVEPKSRYPQPGARSWQDEMLTTALHEVHHFRHPDHACTGGRCEIAAERYAQHWRRRLSRQARRCAR